MIICENLIELATICAQLTREGIEFKARTHNLTIELTGSVQALQEKYPGDVGFEEMLNLEKSFLDGGKLSALVPVAGLTTKVKPLVPSFASVVSQSGLSDANPDQFTFQITFADTPLESIEACMRALKNAKPYVQATKVEASGVESGGHTATLYALSGKDRMRIEQSATLRAIYLAFGGDGKHTPHKKSSLHLALIKKALQKSKKTGW